MPFPKAAASGRPLSFIVTLLMTCSFDRNVYLIGPMGSGKSAVGRYLARQLQL